MVAVLVIKNAGVVRSAGTIRTTRGLYQRTVLKQISTRSEMDFPIRRNGLVFVQIVIGRGKPVMAALKGQPAFAFQETVAESRGFFRHRVVGIYEYTECCPSEVPGHTTRRCASLHRWRAASPCRRG